MAALQPLFMVLKCKYRSFGGKMLRARQDKLCRTPWGFRVQEAEGQWQEHLWGEVKERRVTRTKPTGKVTPVPPQLDFFGLFSLQACNRCHCLQATNGNSGDGDKLDVGACGNTNQGNPVGCKGTRTATVWDHVWKPLLHHFLLGSCCFVLQSLYFICTAFSGKGCTELGYNEWSELVTVGYL